ncbi:MAG: alpha/beta fold hydrolase [Sulfitobacter sp.]
MTLTTLRLSKSNRHVSFSDHGKGEPLVLLHGVGMQSAAWAPQIEALQTRYRVIALNLPGHGDSDPLPMGSQLPDFVDWCHEVLCALDLPPVNLTGHSMGALIAAGYAVTYPDMVRRVALLNGVYCREPTARDAVISRAADIRAGQVDLETPLNRWFGDTTPIEKTARALVADWLNSVDLDGYATAYTAFAHGDATYANQLSQLACPFLALTGDGDLNSTPAMSKSMSAQAQNGHAVVIEGHRHMVNLTAATQVNAHLLEWLQQSELTKDVP